MTKKYNIIYADPPWQYDFSRSPTRAIENQYPTMELEQIKKMPLPAIAEDAVLLMWATAPKLREALEVVEAWGFEYKTVAWAWVKQTSKGNPHFGMGHYTRGATEPCLLGIKGRMPVKDKGVIARIDAPVREHSRKPDEQYEKIERLYPDVPKLEMFARYEWPNWDSWGNEVKNSVDLNIDPSGVQQE